MDELSGTTVLACLLPLLLAAVWLAAQVRRGSASPRFFLVAVGLCVLCLVGGVAVAVTAPSGQEVSGQGLGSAAAILLLLNGVSGLVGALVLGVLSGVLALVRRRRA